MVNDQTPEKSNQRRKNESKWAGRPFSLVLCSHIAISRMMTSFVPCSLGARALLTYHSRQIIHSPPTPPRRARPPAAARPPAPRRSGPVDQTESNRMEWRLCKFQTVMVIKLPYTYTNHPSVNPPYAAAPPPPPAPLPPCPTANPPPHHYQLLPPGSTAPAPPPLWPAARAAGATRGVKRPRRLCLGRARA